MEAQFPAIARLSLSWSITLKFPIIANSSHTGVHPILCEKQLISYGSDVWEVFAASSHLRCRVFRSSTVVFSGTEICASVFQKQSKRRNEIFLRLASSCRYVCCFKEVSPEGIVKAKSCSLLAGLQLSDHFAVACNSTRWRFHQRSQFQHSLQQLLQRCHRSHK